MPFLTDSEIIASASILENIRVCHTNQKREEKKREKLLDWNSGMILY